MKKNKRRDTQYKNNAWTIKKRVEQAVHTNRMEKMDRLMR